MAETGAPIYSTEKRRSHKRTGQQTARGSRDSNLQGPGLDGPVPAAAVQKLGLGSGQGVDAAVTPVIVVVPPPQRLFFFGRGDGEVPGTEAPSTVPSYAHRLPGGIHRDHGHEFVLWAPQGSDKGKILHPVELLVRMVIGAMARCWSCPLGRNSDLYLCLFSPCYELCLVPIQAGLWQGKHPLQFSY